MTNYPYRYGTTPIKLIKSWWGWRTPVTWLCEDFEGNSLILYNHEFYHPQKI